MHASIASDIDVHAIIFVFFRFCLGYWTGAGCISSKQSLAHLSSLGLLGSKVT